MKSGHSTIPFRLLAVASILMIAPSGCNKKPAPAAGGKKPAKVEKLPQETEIARITLTPEAHKRLDISYREVKKEKVERRRAFGGEVFIPPGKSIIVSAPVPGKVMLPGDPEPTQGVSPETPPSPPVKELLAPGSHVQVGDVILRLAPLLTPERYVPTPAERLQMANARATFLAAQIAAKGDVDRSHAEVEAARIILKRAQELLEGKAGSVKAVEDARAQLNIAESVSHAAVEREKKLAELARDLEPSTEKMLAEPLSILAPETGILRNLQVSQGQTVNVGAPLFEVVNTRSVWIRVPIYPGLVSELRPDLLVRVVGLDGRKTTRPRTLTLAKAPPSADPLSTTVDLVFVCDNQDGSLRPGERVGVEVAMKGEGEALVVPAGALLYDIVGGTWVYVKVGENQVERRRVLVQFTLPDDRVVLALGPEPGTEVAVQGVAELFGIEFGAGK